MAGDEDKKVKKKKVKKVEKAAAEEAPPAPEPEPVAAEPAAAEEAPAPPAEGAPPAAEEEGGAPPADGEVIAEPPPAPKKKPKFFIHWNRKKPKFYDYNYDYGESYYSPVVGYLDSKNLGSHEGIPRRMGFAERGVTFSLIRKSQPDLLTQSILYEVKNSIRGFETFQRTYAQDMQRKYM